MQAGHLDHDCAFGFAPRLLAFDHGQRRIDGDLRHPAVRQARCGLKLIKSRIDEFDRSRTERGLQAFNPNVVVAFRRQRPGNVAVDPLQFDADAGFLCGNGQLALAFDQVHHFPTFANDRTTDLSHCLSWMVSVVNAPSL